MNKYIIGLGCSWTQGKGGLPADVYKSYNGRADLNSGYDMHLRPYEYENSWVNVICRDYFTDHKPINLGVQAIGNRAAVKQLYFNDADIENSTGYVILLLTGIERFDFFKKVVLREKENYNKFHYLNDVYGTYGYTFYKWRTMFPAQHHKPQDKDLWKVYQTELWSDQFVASEILMALLELQAWCKANNFKMVVANAFNQLGVAPTYNLQEYIEQHTGTLSSKFDWSCYLHETADYCSMIQKLIQLDGLMDPKDWVDHCDFYPKFDWPPRYLTNCIHPNVDGYKAIASELVTFIKQKYHA